MSKILHRIGNYNNVSIAINLLFCVKYELDKMMPSLIPRLRNAYSTRNVRCHPHTHFDAVWCCLGLPRGQSEPSRTAQACSGQAQATLGGGTVRVWLAPYVLMYSFQ